MARGSRAVAVADRSNSVASRTYRPEIDGLRAVAVLAVLINHLNHDLLPGGYLGVDLFFVISGAVVTGSLLGRPATGAGAFLLDFYHRRFRRLLPALLVNILVVAVLFSALVNPTDAVVKPSLRTGMTALFGFANMYLLRQGTNYFATDTAYNPFTHTWSLGVEEQFYLVWPLLLLACGQGWKSLARVRRSLGWTSIGLGLASLLFMAVLQQRGQAEASFYLMPARFWELVAGALAWLFHSAQRKPTLPSRIANLCAMPMLAILVALMFTPESWRVAATLTCVAISAVLLILLDSVSGAGRLLATSLPLAIGHCSYSLYLWHWPVIVLARWSVGLNRFTLLPVLALICLATWLSYQLECHFRRAGQHGSTTGPGRMIIYPTLVLGSAGALVFLQGPSSGRFFLGDPSHLSVDTGNSRGIPGTTVNSVNCFREPTAPLDDLREDQSCVVRNHPSRPTLFFEGDSHTEMLMPLGDNLLKNAAVNVAFFSRGGCPIPWFSPWKKRRDTLERYKLCPEHSQLRLSQHLQQMAPGDQLVLTSFFPSYLLDTDPKLRATSLANFATALRKLAASLEQRGAGLVVFGPMPIFNGRSSLALPTSLCQAEWFRPVGHLPLECRPTLTSRQAQLDHLAPLDRQLSDLEAELPNLRVFRPFSLFCSPATAQCSTHMGERMLFADSNHLSNEGVKVLNGPLVRFLRDQGISAPAQRPSARPSPPSS